MRYIFAALLILLLPGLVFAQTFEESTEYIENPGMGVVPGKYIGISGIYWSNIEQEKGVYSFPPIDTSKQTMIAFILDQPRTYGSFNLNRDLDIPWWLFDEMCRDAGISQAQVQSLINQFNSSWARNTDIPGVGTLYRMVEAGYAMVGFSPNYSSPLLIDYHRQALKAVAEQYDNEHTYMMIMGSIGHWGEMHTYFVNRGRAGSYPPKHIGAMYYNEYAQFENTFVSSRHPREVARDNGFGLHNHSFGDHRATYDWFRDWYLYGYTCYYTGDSHPAMPDFWKHAPSGAEVAFYDNHIALRDSRINATIQQARDTHLTWILQPWRRDAEIDRNFNRLLSKIGYRFFVENAGIKDNNMFSMDIVNRGTAPFYYDWQLVIRSAEQVYELGSPYLLPNESKTYSVELPAGSHDVELGIIDESGEAKVKFIIDVPVRDNWHSLGRFIVEDDYDPQPTGRMEHIVYIVGEQHIVVDLDWLCLYFEIDGSQLWDYLSNGDPQIYAVGSGEKFIYLTEYASNYDGSVMNAVSISNHIPLSEVSNYFMLEGFDEDDNPVLIPINSAGAEG